ncbi:isopenicillin N synthase family oxygenase [Nakamurella sp. YIM 132087]|uniref:Isopenicillin N synthase family oxygenase n=1 Tax=Nakamurella alba TaxID=2665158 RepID=A0A7K1FGH7_9ACTN|nr:2-oxoglutarate and iron-dependent oxygenase domain-containing protein [Nakamurella alba]MTD13208.1 isopenicillin N synthase family oxygenase [Nakamurella alba]
MTYVPILDLTSDDETLARALDEVCTEVGFFQIVGHGVDPAVEERLWSTLRAFFDLPDEDKLALRPEPGEPYGYIPVSAESLAKSLGVATPGDLKESINLGPMQPPAHELSDPDEASVYQPNRWPDALPELQQVCADYYAEMSVLSERLMRLFALALDLPRDFFDPMMSHAPSALRAINYPETDQPLAIGQQRAGAHTDYGLLTILRQDAVGGLQVVDKEQNWVDVPSVPGGYVINIGDLMARWTNDRWQSTLHRVVNPVGGAAAAARRQSVPFFFNANWDAVVSCLPSCLEPGESPKYEPVTAGPHLMGKFRRTVTA